MWKKTSAVGGLSLGCSGDVAPSITWSPALLACVAFATVGADVRTTSEERPANGRRPVMLQAENQLHSPG
eukprot:1055311-Prymnesium_polylepis.2